MHFHFLCLFLVNPLFIGGSPISTFQNSFHIILGGCIISIYFRRVLAVQ